MFEATDFWGIFKDIRFSVRMYEKRAHQSFDTPPLLSNNDKT